MRVLISCLAAGLAAGSLSAAEHDIEEVVVTGPFHETVAESALPVGVLSGEALRRAVQNSLGDTLNGELGVHSASFGPGVGQPVIRGQSGKRVQVLQNSVFVSDAANLSPDHANGIEPLLAQSIEVVRGPATLLYGSGAIGGVVNVIDTRIPGRLYEQPELVFEQSHSSVSDEDRTLLGVTGSVGGFSFHGDYYSRRNNDVEVPGFAIDEAGLEQQEALAGIEHEEEEEEAELTRGYIENSSGEGEGGTVGFSFVQENSFIGFSYNRFDSEYGLPGGSHSHGHGHDEDHEADHDDEDHDEDHHDEDHGEEEGEEQIRLGLEQERYDLKGDYHFAGGFFSEARFHMGFTDYEHREIEIEGDGTQAIGTQFLSKGYDSRFSLTTRERGGWQGIWGLQVNDTEFAAIGEEAFIPATDIRNTALFVVERLRRESFLLELGARIERSELDPGVCNESDTVFSASASLVKDVFTNSSLTSTVSRTERAPTVEERYSNINASDCSVNTELVTHAATNLIEISNQDLDTEVSMNLEVGYQWAIGSAQLDVTGFYNRVDDYIYLQVVGLDADDTQIANYLGEDARFYGIEGSLEFPLVDLSTSRLEGRVLMDTVRGRFTNGDAVPRLSPARVGLELDWLSADWTAGLAMVRVFEQDDVGPLELSTSGYTDLSAYADYHWRMPSGGEVTLFARGDNLLDTEIRNHVSFLKLVAPEAGRSVRLGVRFEY